MKKGTILAIFALIAVIGVGVIIKFSQESDTNKTSNESKKEETATTAAGEIGEGEVALDNTNFDTEIREAKGVALVDMYAPNCKYCIMVGPIISEIAKENQGTYKIAKLDLTVAENKPFIDEFKVEGTPTLVIFKDGKEVDRIVGFKEKEAILDALEKQL